MRCQACVFIKLPVFDHSRAHLRLFLLNMHSVLLMGSLHKEAFLINLEPLYIVVFYYIKHI